MEYPGLIILLGHEKVRYLKAMFTKDEVDGTRIKYTIIYIYLNTVL